MIGIKDLFSRFSVAFKKDDKMRNPNKVLIGVLLAVTLLFALAFLAQTNVVRLAWLRFTLPGDATMGNVDTGGGSTAIPRCG